MGKTGTDVAKGAADMILTDDNFATVVAAVEQGRGIYANIRKAIHYLLSCNIGEILTIFLATLLPVSQAPLSPVQLLWLNLVTDSLPALALGMEPVEKTAMTQPPRGKEEPLFSRAFSRRLAWQGALVGGITLLAYGLGFHLTGTFAVANTMAFATLTFSQLFHAFDVRSETTPLFRLGVAVQQGPMNKAFLAGAALQAAVLLAPPLQGAFSVVPLALEQWGMVLALALTPPGGVRDRKGPSAGPGPGEGPPGKRRALFTDDLNRKAPSRALRLGAFCLGGGLRHGDGQVADGEAFHGVQGEDLLEGDEQSELARFCAVSAQPAQLLEGMLGAVGKGEVRGGVHKRVGQGQADPFFQGKLAGWGIGRSGLGHCRLVGSVGVFHGQEEGRQAQALQGPDGGVGRIGTRVEGLAVGQFDAGALGFLGEGEGELPLPFHQQGRLNLWLCRFPLGTIGEGIGGIGQVFQLEGDLTHGESTVVPQEVKEEVEAAAIGRSSQELCTSPQLGGEADGGGIAAAKGPLKAGRFKRIALVSIWVSGGGSLFRQHRLTICPLHTAEEEGAFAVSQHGFNGDGHPVVGVAGQHRLGELLDELHLLRLRAKAGRQSVHSFLQHPRGAGGAQGGGRRRGGDHPAPLPAGGAGLAGLGGRQQPGRSWPASVPQRRPGRSRVSR